MLQYMKILKSWTTSAKYYWRKNDALRWTYDRAPCVAIPTRRHPIMPTLSEVNSEGRDQYDEKGSVSKDSTFPKIRYRTYSLDLRSITTKVSMFEMLDWDKWRHLTSTQSPAKYFPYIDHSSSESSSRSYSLLGHWRSTVVPLMLTLSQGRYSLDILICLTLSRWSPSECPYLCAFEMQFFEAYFVKLTFLSWHIPLICSRKLL